MRFGECSSSKSSRQAIGWPPMKRMQEGGPYESNADRNSKRWEDSRNSERVVGLVAAHCPRTGDSSALAVRPSSNYYKLRHILRNFASSLNHFSLSPLPRQPT